MDNEYLILIKRFVKDIEIDKTELPGNWRDILKNNAKKVDIGLYKVDEKVDGIRHFGYIDENHEIVSSRIVRLDDNFYNEWINYFSEEYASAIEAGEYDCIDEVEVKDCTGVTDMRVINKIIKRAYNKATNQ